jgi:hypothetical protein
MKTMKLSFAALALVALTQATGCIFVSDDEVDQGVFRTTWTLTQNGSTVSCGDVGADGVSFLSTAASTNMGYDDVFNCTALAGNTSPLPLDDYQISVSVLDAQDNVLGQTPNPLQASFLGPCDLESDGTCFVDLPNIEFAFSP